MISSGVYSKPRIPAARAQHAVDEADARSSRLPSRRPGELRSARGDRRGAGTRARGGYTNKGERDAGDGYRFDSKASPDASGAYANSKFYDKESGMVFHLPEDPRISKLLRKLCAEADVEKSLAVCGKLQEAVMLPENARYIRRSYDILAESLLDVFYDAPGPETKENAAIVLGRIGYVMGPDFKKHLDWIASQYALHNSTVRHYLVLSFSETFQLDYENGHLGEFAAETMTQLQSVIEGTDSANIFMSAVDAMVLLSNSYPEDYAKHFIDTVDILVGWHVDNTQPKKIKDFALNTLFKLSQHWQANVSFSVSLLNQFIEDLVTYGNDLSGNSTDDMTATTASQEECVPKITSFINVFNTVVKSVGMLLSPNISKNVTWAFLTESMSKVLQVMIKAVKSDVDTDLILAGNECVCLLLEYIQLKLSSSAVLLFQLIDLEQLKYLESEDDVCCSVIRLIAKTVKEVSSNLPLEFINKIIGPDSLLLPLRFSDSALILEGVLAVYANLLNLKNIPLLQETYKCVLIDLQNAYSSLVPDIQIISIVDGENIMSEDAEKNVIFYLQCLSELANASNSIIGMWALQPSILELLAVKMNPHNKLLSRHYPVMQYSILYLLYSHCKKNNHFVASSEIVSNVQHRANVRDIFGLNNLSIGDVSTSSPTSGHFGIILNTLTLLMKADLPDETLLLMLTWSSDIFHQVDKYLPIVNHSKTFVQLLSNMISLGNHFNPKIVGAVVKNVKPLLRNKNVTWNNTLLKEIAALCLLQMDNKDLSVSAQYMSVLFEIPWDLVQLELDKQLVTVYSSRKRSKYHLSSDSKINALKDYLMRGPFVSMSTQHFKMIVATLLHASFEDENSMHNAFMTCWPLQSQESDECNLLFFRQCADNYSSVCTAWVMSELAQLCVTLKLRTPLGKPQETFMRVEGALKGIAREISSTESKFVSNAKAPLMRVIIVEQARSRRITEFMLFLEKYIYNAAEGTATVLPPVSKPVRTFFHTNWPTCREWLTRVRPASLAVGLFSGHYGAGIYHAQVMLQMAAASPTNIDVEAITMTVSRALIKLREPELLLGLYIWIKKKFNKKFQWLKAAAEQANSRHEFAVEYYRKLSVSLANPGISEESGESLPVDTRAYRFLQEQIADCYKNIQSWENIQEWKDLEEQNKNYSPWHSFASLQAFEENADFVHDLSNWDVLTFETESIPKNGCSYQNLLNKVESTLVYTAVNIYHNDDLSKYSGIIEECQSLLNANTVEFTRSASSHFLKDITILQLANEGLKRVMLEGKSITNPFRPSSEKLSKVGTHLENLGKIMWWNQFFTRLNMTEENLYYTECMRLDVIKSARKHANTSWGKRELLKHFKANGSFQAYLGNINTLDELCDVLLISNNTYDFDIWSTNNATALMELCKLLYVSEETKTKAINVCASVSLGVSQRLAMGEQNYDLREKGTRMLLTLSKWVQNEDETIILRNLDSPLTKLVTALPEIGLVDNNISDNVIPLSDSAVGKLLQFSVNQCPGLAKAWSNFANWCFRWGRKMVEYSSKTGEQLTEMDKLQIESVMLGCSPQDFEAVCEILSKTKATCDDEDIDWNEINTSEMIENQLRTVPSLTNAFPEHIALLVDIWRQAQKRVFSYYELSADAYFKFLQLICASDYINHSGEYAVVSATLRLLRLIVKHAMELQTVLESGLASTPTQPWKVIIPQLFSRLNHPETYVRKCVSDLLCRLAEDTPHLITFPAVVGAVENEQIDLSELNLTRSFLTNGSELDGQEIQEASDGDSEKVINNDLNSCFLDMVETLSKQAPETILQVKLLVKELQRINLLWDELWLGTLAQHHSEFTKRLAQLENEVAKVRNNSSLTPEDKTRLIQEKHRIIFEPIIFVLEQLDHITSDKAETPHEIAFQNKFQSLIADVICKLKNPASPEKPQESWAPLKQLQIKFQQKVNKRTSYILKMSDISPILAQLRHTVISMPGVQSNQNARITIKSVENNVAILPTKTKPKKLVFHGSDGKPYTYLFKGLEDLHLDERIMQFLSIANTMMARDTENNENQTYRARHYSVIPLGPRSGLISWVDNVTPLFALYKRWQHREAAIASMKTNKTPNVLRPSELFYNKLNPLLAAAGASAENRKEWPVSVLKQVLSELTAETPSDLLWRELWCGSITPDQWWQTIRRYSYSMAVMSTIGYIIGLGDRHLDNVLVDLTTGEVVHIDYNVCFEKGKTLRVPEKVPFRMTPNLVHALGVTGVEGIFRVSCEHVLKVMRRGRETLLTLLEAFVYDPLVEWGGGAGATTAAAGAGGGSASRRRRRQLEARAAADMFAVRCQEIRQQWNENKDLLMSTLPPIKDAADKWLEENEKLKMLNARLQDCHQQMGLIKEVEAYGVNLNNHPLYAISQKYTTYKQAKNAVEDSMKTLLKIVEDFDVQIEGYTAAMEAINGPQLMQWIQDFSGLNEQDDQHIFDLIRDFLTNAGQSSMISQCEQAEGELIHSLQQVSALLRSCLDLLSQYASIAQYYPQSYTEHHKIVTFRKWIAAVLESKSPEMCREVSGQVASALAAENPNNPAAQQIISFNYQLQTINAEANVRLTKAMERLSAHGGGDAVPHAHELYLEAKANVGNFVRQEKGAAAAIECVAVGMLCALNRRYLMLEGGAQSAGDCLVDLTSREGEWFLDDMSALSAQIVELLSLIPLKSVSGDDGAIPVAINSVRSANVIFDNLIELNFNFQTIILPEALKKIHAEEPSVLLMINELNSVILNTPCPLNELLGQLEMHLRYLIMEMESPSGSSQVLVAELRGRYEALMNTDLIIGDEEGSKALATQTSGRMLLMGFNGLFAPLTVHGADLMEALMSLPIPHVWKKIDQISEAIDMSAPLQSEHLRSVLDDIFFIKRVQGIAEVFALCAQMSCSFKGVGPVTIYDEERLCKPVKRFTADYVGRQLLGVHSRALGTALCLLLRRTGLDLHAEIEQKEIGPFKHSAGSFNELHAIVHPNSFCSCYCNHPSTSAKPGTLCGASWKVPLEGLCEKAAERRACGGAALLERAAALAAAVERARRTRDQADATRRANTATRVSARCVRLRLSAHSRLHATVLAGAGGGAAGGAADPAPALARRALELTAAAERLRVARGKAQALVTSAHQRVKWGAGANPALSGPLAALESGWERRATRADALLAAAHTLVAHARALALARTPHAKLSRTVRQALASWEKACSMAVKCALNVSEVEESLMELLHPEGVIDVQWVDNVSALLRDIIQQLGVELLSARDKLQQDGAQLAAAAARLAPALAAHTALADEVRPLLHTLAHHPHRENEPAGLYLAREKAGAEMLRALAGAGAADAQHEAAVLLCRRQAQQMLQATPALYADLLRMETVFAADGPRRLVRQAALAGHPTKTQPNTKQGEQNAQGAGVWKRVRLKLEGRDPDPNRKCNAHEQVEYILSEALSAENLCVLYEGWMAWV